MLTKAAFVKYYCFFINVAEVDILIGGECESQVDSLMVSGVRD